MVQQHDNLSTVYVRNDQAALIKYDKASKAHWKYYYELYNSAFHAVSAPIISDVKCPIDRDLRQFRANETTFLSQRSWINRRSAPHLAFPSAWTRRAPLTFSFHVRKSSDLSSLIFTSTRQSEQRTHTNESHVFDSFLKEEISKATLCNQTSQ